MPSIITYSVVLFPMLVALEQSTPCISVNFASLVPFVSRFSLNSHLAEVLVHTATPHNPAQNKSVQESAQNTKLFLTVISVHFGMNSIKGSKTISAHIFNVV